MKTISKSTQAAVSVNTVFPSFKELVTNPQYQIGFFEKDPGVRWLINSAKLYDMEVSSVRKTEIVYAEVIAQLVQHMVNELTGHDFYGFYEMGHQKGKCEVFDASHKSYILNPQEFFALLKIFWFSYLQIPFTDEQMEAYREFSQDPKIYRILD